MDKFPIDILQYHIFVNLDFLSQIRLRQVCKWFYRLEIYDMYNIDTKYLCRLSDKILNCYPYVKYLNVSNNKNVTNINHLTLEQSDSIASATLKQSDSVVFATRLQQLDASENCGINDNGIKFIIELDKF